MIAKSKYFGRYIIVIVKIFFRLKFLQKDYKINFDSGLLKMITLIVHFACIVLVFFYCLDKQNKDNYINLFISC